ncbi:MAG TPA: PQQ-dependent sugar dehydrogenase [Gemmatimonadales bacterium]
MLRGPLLAALAPLLIASACGGEDQAGPPPASSGVGLELVASGLQFPVLATTPPTEPGRLFVVEKRGVVRIVKNGSLLATPFLDIRSKVSTGGEQGLLGFAFHPSYATNGVFVVSYTNADGDTRVATMKVSANPDVADPASERVFLELDQPYPNHNGGHVTFNPLGFLYVGLGDGGGSGDPDNRAQNRQQLFGKLLRYSIDAQGAATIPPSNPFYGRTDSRWELWSLGLRNPWRFSFDRALGDLYVADVGQSQLEEVNVRPAVFDYGRGTNFGWPVMEGTQCYRPATGCSRSGLTLPLLEYGHADGCSVTGGFVYRGAALPDLVGTYFYADYCRAWVRSFKLVQGRPAELKEWPELAPGGQVTSFGEDAAGELYVVTADGKVHKVVPR